MDQIHEVEVFRSMLNQNGVVSPDGSEPILTGLLCSDASAVVHFYSLYFSQPQSYEERAIRSAYSSLERGQMLSKDLMILALWGQYLESNRLAFGFEAASERIRNLGFSAFRRLDYQEMREMIASVRSKVTATLCDLRETVGQIGRLSTKKFGKLLEKKLSN